MVACTPSATARCSRRFNYPSLRFCGRILRYTMDVERLMRDLNIDQLAEIQSNLVTEVEDKKEELRQMVGRRYRDVLDASNCVQKLAEMADRLKICITEAHKLSPLVSSIRLAKTPGGSMNEQSIYRFALLDRLQREIDVTNDSLSDAFVLLLAENFHRSLNVEANLPSSVCAALRRLSPLFMKQRRELFEHCESKLGELNEWNETTSVLLAIASLHPATPEDLVDRYFNARMEKVSRCIAWSNSLIDVLSAMHETVTVVDCIFGDGKVYSSALDTISVEGWKPDCVQFIINDQLSAYGHFVNFEIARVNRTFANLQNSVERGVLEEKCTAWVTTICDVVNQQMDQLCKHIESTELVIDFLSMACELLRSKWPIINSQTMIYEKMFGEKLLNRFITLIQSELSGAEGRLLSGWTAMTLSDPGSLFQKRSEKFDPLLASGVPKSLNKLIETFNGELDTLFNAVKRFEKLGKGIYSVVIGDRFGDMVLELVERLTNRPSTLSEQPLRRFRLYLALIGYQPSVLCSSLDRSGDKIQKCSRLLNEAANDALCEHLDSVITSCMDKCNLKMLGSDCSQLFKMIDILQENEKVELDQVGVFMIPTQVNRRFYEFLLNVANVTVVQGIGHLCNNKVRDHLKRSLGKVMGNIMLGCSENCCSVSAVCFQLLFDARVIHLLFPSEEITTTIHKIESKLDPFDLSIVSDLITQNAKIAVKRNSLLFGQMTGEPVFSGDTVLRESYNQLIDVTPRIHDVPRLSLIPRLSKYREMERDSKADGALLGLPSLTRETAKSSSTSLSSFYDKISTSWFRKE